MKKALELPYVKTLLQNSTDDGTFQNFKFIYVERAKITICINGVILTNKVMGCVKSHFEGYSDKDIIQAAYKVLNSWTVMEETPMENTRGSGCETDRNKENSCNGDE